MIKRTAITAVTAIALAMPLALTSHDANAGVVVKEKCINAVCSEAVYKSGKVRISFRSKLSRTTHYNFKTNPGAQIELRTNGYTFEQDAGNEGTYSVQPCAKGGINGSGIGGRSTCGKWATFRWSTGAQEEMEEQ
jgi:hypothetical protein